MNTLIEFVQTSDILSLIIVIWILASVGKQIVRSAPQWERRGWLLATLAFVAFGVRLAILERPSSADGLLPIVLRALAFAGLTLGIAWITLPMIGLVLDKTVGEFCRQTRSCLAVLKSRIKNSRATRKAKRERDEADRQYAQLAPERARQRQVEIEERRRAAAEQARRDKARADCLRLFLLLARDVKSRFSRKMFDEYALRYLADNRTADDVEGHAEKLKALMQQHYEKIEPPAKFRSLNDVARWFQAEKKSLEAIDDEKMRRSLIARLNQRYAELTTQFFEEST
jgi:hypothetical protein